MRGLLCRIAVLVLVLQFLPLPASAAQLTSRKVTLGSSAPSASTSYTFDYTVATNGTVAAIDYQVCTTASGTCTTPSGWAAGAFSTTNFSGTWSNSVSAGRLRATSTGASSTTAGAGRQMVFTGVTNGNTANQSFYIRITTYSDSFVTSIDTGVVAASTATQIVLTGTMPESLVFCTGGTITGTDCGTATSGSVSFNQLFSPTSTATATSQMVASTNAATGYVITVNGTTLASGINTITAMAASTTSAIGTKQFGLNVVANTTPSVGTAITPAANGTNLKGEGATGYGTANNFKFVTGETVASSTNGGAGPTDAQNYTVSYIANVTGSQAAGVYTTTLTYICTATF